MEDDVSVLLDAIRMLDNKKQKSNKKIHENEVENWKELPVGAVVKSVQGYGPYFENSRGEKTFQGSYGYYKIDSITDDGFYAYEYSPRGKRLDFGGRRFIYMGETKKVDVIYRSPHKLIKVN